jgi:tetratricopeptide (TPR) repeat protein
MKYLVAFLFAVSASSPAFADWHEAQSEHFVVYADDSADDVKKFAEMLERYHSALGILTRRDIPSPSPSNRLTIFAVGSERDVRRLMGENARNVAGFYLPRAGGSRAFVPDVRISHGEPHFSFIVLLHEYAHHFLIGSSRHAMPRWLSEGAAEFFASSRFPRDGSIQIGRPAYHRAGELYYAADVTVEELLDHELYEQNRGKAYDAFYGRAWALYHYLTFSEERAGQLAQYWRTIAEGTAARAAAEQVFGDLDVLERELDAYLRQRRIHTFDLKPELVPIGTVTVRRLSDGMDKAMPLRIRSQRGVTREKALELLPEAREVAARYPNDAGVLAMLAEAEHDAGNDAEAIAAADRAIAIDSTVENAYVQKGLSLFRIASEADEPDAAYAAAMVPFSELNQLENDHPLPLIYYYRSFVERGEAPTETAKHALERAAELAPFDRDLALNAAIMQMGEGKIELARYNLKPVASDPHAGDLADQARALLETLDGVEEGTALQGGELWDDPEIAASDMPAEPAGEARRN